ncbi:thrombospondin type-1 domain-containing protein 1 [Roseibium sp. TrichSKD4]|nr:thrombospondin type-1 domain-containing protein 1 [Roseibium sp. TrichSKD4]
MPIKDTSGGTRLSHNPSASLRRSVGERVQPPDRSTCFPEKAGYGPHGLEKTTENRLFPVD